MERFQDLQKNITVGDIENGVTMLVKRPGVKDPIKFSLHPDLTRGLPTIGILSSCIALIKERSNPQFRARRPTQAKPPLQTGDRIVMIDGVKVENYRQLLAALAEHPDKPLQLTVECTVPAEGRKRDALETSKLVNVAVPPQPMRTLGLVMTMGEIMAVQDGSPAAWQKSRPTTAS